LIQLKRIITIVAAFILILPLQALADGALPEEKGNLTTGTYFFIAFGVLLLVFATAYGFQKWRLTALRTIQGTKGRTQRNKIDFRVKTLKWGGILSAIGLILTIGINLETALDRRGQISLDHIHGIGYSQDGKRLLFAAHDGIKILSEGRWSIGPGGKHDFMGFSMVDDGFYGSGHPAIGSGLKEPFGIIHSLDDGKTIEPLAFIGQIDFHLMTAGYRAHTLYVYNPQPLPELQETGLYFSTDDGKTWSKSEEQGLAGQWLVMAAHPDEPAIVAIGTMNGLYISRDYGKTFQNLLGGKQVTSLAFHSKDTLYAGTIGEKPELVEMKIDGTEMKEKSLPPLTDDAVMQIAVNPQNEQELTIATYNRQAYTSFDQGNKWQQILFNGTTKQ